MPLIKNSGVEILRWKEHSDCFTNTELSLAKSPNQALLCFSFIAILLTSFIIGSVPLKKTPLGPFIYKYEYIVNISLIYLCKFVHNSFRNISGLIQI